MNEAGARKSEKKRKHPSLLFLLEKGKQRYHGLEPPLNASTASAIDGDPSLPKTFYFALPDGPQTV
jgi:hypothetical protein